MATTVDSAFSEFMRDKVNLEMSKTSTARTSRDNLINNINGFSGDDDFFNIYVDRNLKFGSFARRTKIREIDDIDLMICISADGSRTYSEDIDCIHITGDDNDRKNRLLTEGTSYLNSTKVINRFVSKLSDLSDYDKAELHKNHEATTLKMKSYTWNFDIVPCFYTTGEFYLIPDGKGNWKRTDPRIDNARTTLINQKHNGNLLNLIRLVKYWNNRRVTIKMNSYLLECMILNKYETMETPENWWIDFQFRDTLEYLATAILDRVDDPKGMQGDLNIFSWEDRCKISEALSTAHEKAVEAVCLEIIIKDQKEAIAKWQEILGPAFPDYTDI